MPLTKVRRQSGEPDRGVVTQGRRPRSQQAPDYVLQAGSETRLSRSWDPHQGKGNGEDPSHPFLIGQMQFPSDPS
jgi:hypothetical protein